jgi:hypothetical protein
MSILISWGETRPNDKLVELMIAKGSAYHFIRGPVRLVYDYRWAKEGEEPASYDYKCWHLRDDSQVSADSRGLEGCQGMMEGLQEGWVLAQANALPKARKRAEQPA